MGRPVSSGMPYAPIIDGSRRRERRPAERRLALDTNRNKIFKESKLTSLWTSERKEPQRKNKNNSNYRPSHGRSYVGILPISTILTMCSAISMATCFTFFPGNEFSFHERL